MKISSDASLKFLSMGALRLAQMMKKLRFGPLMERKLLNSLATLASSFPYAL